MSTMPLPLLHTTEDGSPTLYNSALGEHYHSTHGALQESRHIFIEAGLRHRLHSEHRGPLYILEIGFGTGLNALLTAIEAERLGISVRYTTLELYPIPKEVYTQLDYLSEYDGARQMLMCLHEAPWGEEVAISNTYSIYKEQADWSTYTPQGDIDLIYFDAFSPETQPELWEEERFARLFAGANAGAVLTTYCAKGEVRRRLQRSGFVVERLAGPPGKREILRATKPSPKAD